jgi:transposase InsO family protein
MEPRNDIPRPPQLSRFVLKGKENWQLWKTDVQLWAKHQKVTGLLSGSQNRPEIEVGADAERLTAFQKELEDFESRQSGLHIALNNVMNEHHRILTMHCSTPAEIWSHLSGLYESRVSTDIIGLRERFQAIRLESAAKIPKFLDDMKLAQTALAAAGKPYDDDELALYLLERLPASMKELQRSIRFGHPDMLKLDNVVTTLLRYHQTQGGEQRPAEVAAISKDGGAKKKADKSKSKCFDCGEKGHWRGDAECKDSTTKSKSKKEQAKGKNSDEAHVALCAFTDGAQAKQSWIIDSAASTSMSPSAAVDDNDKREVMIGNGASLDATGTCRGQRIGNLNIESILVVPEIKANLLSVGAMCDTGCVDEFVFTKNGCKMIKDGKLIAKGVRRERLYVLADQADIAYASVEKWHERLCHFSTGLIKNMASKGSAAGMTIDDAKASKAPGSSCKVCALTRKTNAPFPKESQHRERAPGRTLHVDLCGPMEVESIQGMKYVMPVTDDYCRFTVAYFMAKKSDAIGHLMNAVSYFEAKTGNKVVNIRADNGGEFTSNDAKTRFSQHGIELLTSVPYSPQQNGVAERKNRTLVESTRAMLRTASLPKDYWQYAMAAAVHITNRLPSRANDGRSPYELWTGTVPDISHLRVFGCQAYALVPKQKRQKLDDKATASIFLGYPSSQKGHIMQDMQTKRIFVSRAITFDEWRFPGKNMDGKTDDEEEEKQSVPDWYELPIKDLRTQDQRDVADEDQGEPDQEPDEAASAQHDDDDDDEVVASSNAADDPVTSDAIDDLAPAARRVTWSDLGARSLPARQRKPIERLMDQQEDFRRQGWQDAALMVQDREPETAEEALKDREWRQAMQQEFDSLIENKTWNLVPLPPGRRPITGRWCFKLKCDENGVVVKKKARYVARGFSQKKGIDFEETYAPVISFPSIRILLSLSAELDLELMQMDVDTAYLYGNLKEELYMEQPEGFERKGKNGEQLVCLLKKSIYGLKQAGRCWWKTLDAYLKEVGFQPTTTEPCLYIKTSNDKKIYIGVYVDDLIVAAPSRRDATAIEDQLKSRYSMKPSQPLTFILGVRVTRERARRRLHLSQDAYAKAVLQRFGMEESKAMNTPAEATQSKCDAASVPEASYPYREAVGCLMYLATCTRPDIAYAVSYISRSTTSPTRQDVIGLKRILRYIQGTLKTGISLGGSDLTMTAFADADYATDTESRRSISGNVIMFGGGPVLWSSRRQGCVTLSTVEAEYVALCSVTQEIVWMRELLRELGAAQRKPTIVYEDNQGAISLARGSQIGRRTKHIDVRYHFVREQFEAGAIELEHCSTQDMIADILTKPLGATAFARLRDRLCYTPSRDREGVLAVYDRDLARPIFRQHGELQN